MTSFVFVQELAEQFQHVASCFPAHGEPSNYPAFSSFSPKIGELNPCDESDATFSNLKGPTSHEQAGHNNWFRQRGTDFPISDTPHHGDAP